MYYAEKKRRPLYRDNGLSDFGFLDCWIVGSNVIRYNGISVFFVEGNRGFVEKRCYRGTIFDGGCNFAAVFMLIVLTISVGLLVRYN